MPKSRRAPCHRPRVSLPAASLAHTPASAEHNLGKFFSKLFSKKSHLLIQGKGERTPERDGRGPWAEAARASAEPVLTEEPVLRFGVSHPARGEAGHQGHGLPPPDSTPPSSTPPSSTPPASEGPPGPGARRATENPLPSARPWLGAAAVLRTGVRGLFPTAVSSDTVASASGQCHRQTPGGAARAPPAPGLCPQPQLLAPPVLEASSHTRAVWVTSFLMQGPCKQ